MPSLYPLYADKWCGMRRTTQTALLLVAGLCPGTAVMAAADNLEPVEQAVGDINPLSRSLREIHVGLGQPGDFEQVYRVPGTDRLMRIQGGLYAVFRQSDYAQTEAGAFPIVSADTVFHIGPPPALFMTGVSEEAGAAREFEGRIDALPLAIAPIPPVRLAAADNGSRRLATSSPRSEPPREATPSARATIVSDPGYRAARLRMLMRQAAISRRWRQPGS